MKKYYITTPIYYVNAAPHIGHTYCTMAADTIARWKTMQGYDVLLTSGTDEHGQKIERAAKAAGKTEEEFTRLISAEFENTWKKFGLRVDRFKRTTDPEHHKRVQELFLACKANGYVYKGSYSGAYCVHDEQYENEIQPGDPCPTCGRPTEKVTEENYFFKLSEFQGRLLELYEKNPGFIQPESRRNEVLSFVRQGLVDLSISRTTIQWGIPVPGDEKHVFYVWFDALMTYMSAVDGDEAWPADLHLIGKEILRFHAVFWPAFLMAAGWPLPKAMFAHGFLLFDNDKMSKSKGNLVRPLPILEVVGGEALRYYLLREVVFGQDGNFSWEAMVTRYNSDLANGIGNLVSRTLSMITQYRHGVIPAASSDPAIAAHAEQVIAQFKESFDSLQFSKGLEALWTLLSSVDKLIVERAPWKLIKSADSGDQGKLNQTLYTAAEAVRVAAALLAPVLPESSAKIWAQLGMKEPLSSLRVDELRWGQLPGDQKIGETGPVFPRIDVKAAVDKIAELEEKEKQRQDLLIGKVPEVPTGPAPAPIAAPITIDDFVKVDLRVGLVKSAINVKGSDKLLHLSVDIGEPQPRSIVAGIAEAYKPEQVLGRKVVIVANLAPRKLRGIESQGMIVAASLEGEKPTLAAFLEEVPVGARLK